MSIVKSKIANAIESVAKDRIVATSDSIYDENIKMYQNDINKQIGKFPTDYAKQKTLEDVQNSVNKIVIPSDIAKKGDIPSIKSIQNGLALDSDSKIIIEKLDSIEHYLKDSVATESEAKEFLKK